MIRAYISNVTMSRTHTKNKQPPLPMLICRTQVTLLWYLKQAHRANWRGHNNAAPPASLWWNTISSTTHLSTCSSSQPLNSCYCGRSECGRCEFNHCDYSYCECTHCGSTGFGCDYCGHNHHGFSRYHYYCCDYMHTRLWP